MEDRLTQLDSRVDKLESRLATIDGTLKTLQYLGMAILGVLTPGGLESIGHLTRKNDSPPPQVIYQAPQPLPPPPDPALPPEYRR